VAVHRTHRAPRACHGGIYGLPVSRGVAGSLMFHRADLFEQFGVNPAPTSYAEFRTLCKDVIDAKKSRWALVTPPSFRVGGMRPPVFDGGGFAGTWQSPPVNNFTPLKKASTSRIKELLAVANWLAAPFGTEEYLFRKFGVLGVDYTMDNNNPTPTQAGLTQTVLGVRYIVDAPDTIFVPGDPEATKACWDYQESIIPTSVKDPTVALFSETYSRTGAVLAQHVADAANDILTGRKSLSSWDSAVAQWRSAGGDRIRAEFERQLH
jgi:putative aldouronate transport system substrate-binding protein